jgi:hypothetical protein
MKNILTWAPRILAIIFICFISLFALDSFSGEASFSEKIIGFFIHLVPSFMLVACLLVAWKNRIFGGLLFIVLAMIFTIYFGTYKSPTHFALISFPVFLIGFLFMISKLSLANE